MTYKYLGNFRFSWCDRAIFNPYETFIKAIDYKPALKYWNELFTVEFYKISTQEEFNLFRDRFLTLAIILVSRYPDVEFVKVIPGKPNSLRLEAYYMDKFIITVTDYFREDEVVEVDYLEWNNSGPYPVFKGQLCLTDLDELLNDTVQLSGVWKF